MSPRYRMGAWVHFIYCFILAITNVISVYRDFFDIIGKGIYGVLFILLLLYLLFGYLISIF